MLVLTIKEDGKFTIRNKESGEVITIKCKPLGKSNVSVAIDAPANYRILRDNAKEQPEQQSDQPLLF